PPPERGRVLAEDVEQRVILRERKRQLEDLADEVRHHRAAAAALGLEVRDVRHGHVEGELERVEPLLFAIHRPGSEAAAAEAPGVSVDLGRTLQERLAALKEISIVIEVVEIDLETAPSR